MIRLFETRTIRLKRLRKVRCVFCDLDGTLLTNDSVIHEDVLSAINRVQAAGVRIVIASGRTHGFTNRFASTIDPSSPVISLNGALVKRGDGSILSQELLPDGIGQVLEDLRHTSDAVLTWSLFTADGIYSLEEHPILPSYLRACAEERQRVSDFSPYYHSAVAICAAGPYRSIQKMTVALARKYGARLKRIMYQSGSGSDRYYLEISQKHVNKATGVRTVLGELDLPRRSAAAIGDYTNDVEMCTFVGVSAAMRNGNSAVRECTDFVTLRSNNEGGAADFFRLLKGQRSGR